MKAKSDKSQLVLRLLSVYIDLLIIAFGAVLIVVSLQNILSLPWLLALVAGFYFAYTLGMSYFFKGRTVGKMLTGFRLVSLYTQLTLWLLFLRYSNGLLVILVYGLYLLLLEKNYGLAAGSSMLWLHFLVAVVLIWLVVPFPNGRDVRDRISGTRVIKK